MNVQVYPPVSADLAAFLADAEKCDSYGDVLSHVRQRVPMAMIRRGEDELSVHAPSGDGASGPLGCYGRCLARISRFAIDAEERLEVPMRRRPRGNHFR